jgi:hypothetical protein
VGRENPDAGKRLDETESWKHDEDTYAQHDGGKTSQASRFYSFGHLVRCGGISQYAAAGDMESGCRLERLPRR